jgi:hypothetical protein
MMRIKLAQLDLDACGADRARDRKTVEALLSSWHATKYALIFIPYDGDHALAGKQPVSTG